MSKPLNELTFQQKTAMDIQFILLQMRKERAFIKTKPYSQTLLEELHRKITQHKINF